jgi:hypothetical protein
MGISSLYSFARQRNSRARLYRLTTIDTRAPDWILLINSTGNYGLNKHRHDHLIFHGHFICVPELINLDSLVGVKKCNKTRIEIILVAEIEKIWQRRREKDRLDRIVKREWVPWLLEAPGKVAKAATTSKNDRNILESCVDVLGDQPPKAKERQARTAARSRDRYDQRLVRAIRKHSELNVPDGNVNGAQLLPVCHDDGSAEIHRATSFVHAAIAVCCPCLDFVGNHAVIGHYGSTSKPGVKYLLRESQMAVLRRIHG